MVADRHVVTIIHKFWGQSVHFWSCDITKYDICKIGHISVIFKDRDFWF